MFFSVDPHKFPFPSNGKAHSDWNQISRSNFHRFVSIPFKRESTFRRISQRDHKSYLSFHSLQTGKHIQTRDLPVYIFQHTDEVSIPFKRESTFRRNRVFHLPQRQKKFPFPSNGKAHSDFFSAPTLFRSSDSFHSLQTGKHIQTDPILSPVGPWLQKPKTKRELRRAISKPKFPPKITQTRVYIDPNAIF